MVFSKINERNFFHNTMNMIVKSLTVNIRDLFLSGKDEDHALCVKMLS